ncbi:MAG: dUTP diphosphatase [Rikenellaceae bacterium]|nr:dUTP diphosphatase [Rikenellaceae bacterium]
MKVRVINRSAYDLPKYESALAAGLDVRANIEEAVTIGPLGRATVPTGLYVEIPAGYEIQVRPRSGMAAKHGLTVLNSPGTIDADYRGEIKIILANISPDSFVLNPGERIAQLVLARHERAEWEECDGLTETARGAGGFGHTGRK